MQYSPHLPQAHIDLSRIVKNWHHLTDISAAALPGPGKAVPPALLPEPEGGETVFVWPSQLAVVKADAYGHGHIRVAEALLKEGATLFASGSVQEAVQLREAVTALPPGGRPAANNPAIISLLGLVTRDDVFLCAKHGIIPLVHSTEQLALLEGANVRLAVGIKCNTGMSRLGFNEDELPSFIDGLRKNPKIRPVIALTHMHSADTGQGREMVRVQGAIFARMLQTLRAVWPYLAASQGNSAGTLLAGEIAAAIGPHVCRPGVALYGTNPFAGTDLAPLGQGLLPAMAVSAPVLAVRTLPKGAGIGYGHTHIADKDTRVGIIAAGYADCYTRSLSGRGVVCVEGARAPILGRVSMQMTAVDLSGLPEAPSRPRPGIAWLMGGPGADAVSVEELAHLWGTITYEVLCLLGYNERVYGPYPDK